MTSTGSFISFGAYLILAKRSCKKENIDTNTYLVSIFEVGRVAKKLIWITNVPLIRKHPGLQPDISNRSDM